MSKSSNARRNAERALKRARLRCKGLAKLRQLLLAARTPGALGVGGCVHGRREADFFSLVKATSPNGVCEARSPGRCSWHSVRR